MKYGQLPKPLGVFEIECQEMMFYQYMPIKLKYDSGARFEPRLRCFSKIISKVIQDFVVEFGGDLFYESYVYLTAKHMYQSPNTSFNRMGWHSDGFMTNDINYIWSDSYPTIFNKSKFNLTLDDSISLLEMDLQAKEEYNVAGVENILYRLNQFNIHKVQPIRVGGMRTFVKISFSKDKYDLIGNTRNYLLDYDWEMKERRQERNIPQSTLSKIIE